MDTRNSDSVFKFMTDKAIPLTLQTRLLKARMNSSELFTHIELKSLKSKNSGEHYQVLIRNLHGTGNSLAQISTTMPAGLLKKELDSIQAAIVPLTRQTPYTLLMMRVVEIGLPVLLSLFSMFFVIRYTLTEKRSHEIKELLKQRNIQRAKENDTAAGMATT
jgi:hypothetical protein